MPPRARRRKPSSRTRSGKTSRAAEERARRKAIRDEMAEKARAKCGIRVLEPANPEMREEEEAVDPKEGQEQNALGADEQGDGVGSSAGATEEPPTRTRVLMEIGPFC